MSEKLPTLAILGGTGDLGTGLARRWAQAGYEVIIGSRTIDKAERIKVSREFEIRALTQAYSAPILWWQRIVVLNKKVKGWENQANHFTGQSLVDVWLDQ